MDHALWPVGPVGKPTEFHLMLPVLAMTYTKYPQACKALMAFMLEADNYNTWLEASVGYLTHPLNAYDSIRSGPPIPRARCSATRPSAR